MCIFNPCHAANNSPILRPPWETLICNLKNAISVGGLPLGSLAMLWGNVERSSGPRQGWVEWLCPAELADGVLFW